MGRGVGYRFSVSGRKPHTEWRNETVEKCQNQSRSVIARSDDSAEDEYRTPSESVATKQSLLIAGYEIAALPAVARKDHLNVLINSLVTDVWEEVVGKCLV